MIDFLGADGTADLLTKVIQSIDQHMTELRVAIAYPSQATLCAHRLYGLSATYGLAQLAAAADAIACGDGATMNLERFILDVERAGEGAKMWLRVCAEGLRRPS